LQKETVVKPEIKKLWIEALRSGKYKRGEGALRSEGKHCCLGVLCELRGVKFNGAQEYPNKATQKWAGLSSEDPEVEVEGMVCTSLAELNDAGWTFKRLANLIEKQL
jgi:hypothetical protein